MTVTEFEYKKDFLALRLTYPNGTASVEILLYGAHVVSWTVRDQQILFLRFVILIFIYFILS